MNLSIRLRGKGDGKKRTEDIIIEAFRQASGAPDVRAEFARHPLLSSLNPDLLLGKLSRKRVGRLIETGILSADFELVADAIFPRGRELDISLPLAILLSELDLFPPEPNSENPVETLYEDDSYLAVLKPCGVPSAPLRSSDVDSVVQRVLATHPSLPILRENPLEPGLVHRLDTGTSGVLLFAKTVGAFTRVDQAWNTGSVKKIYRALTSLDPKSHLRMGKVELALGHDLKSKRRMRVVSNPGDLKKIRGEPNRAVSEVLTIRRIPSFLGAPVNDVEIRIETGVHHQIRATLAHFSAPILGDSVYGGASEERVWLHAWKLFLPASQEGKLLEIVAPLPSSWPRGMSDQT